MAAASFVAGAGAGQQVGLAVGVLVDVGDQVGLVELDPGGAALGDPRQQAGVGLEDLLEVGQASEPSVVRARAR